MFTRRKSQEPEINQASDNLENDQVDDLQEVEQDATPPATAAPSVISTDTIVTGDLLSTGELSIDGKVKGNARAFQLQVGESASIEGDLIGDSVSVRGQVHGNIRGVNVELISGCNVRGNILYDQLSMESIATFEGRIQRVENPLSEKAVKSEALRDAVAAQSDKNAAPANSNTAQAKKIHRQG